MEALLMSIPWQGFGWGGLALLVVLMVIRGDLVTRRENRESIELREDVIRRERLIADRAMMALRVLASEHGTTADKVLSALPVPKEDDAAGGDDA